MSPEQYLIALSKVGSLGIDIFIKLLYRLAIVSNVYKVAKVYPKSSISQKKYLTIFIIYAHVQNRILYRLLHRANNSPLQQVL